MSLAIMHSRAQIGVEAPAVSVEIHLTNGLPSLTIVGLPETAVRESKDRVRSFSTARSSFHANVSPLILPPLICRKHCYDNIMKSDCYVYNL